MVKSLFIATNEDIISIDGKTICGAKINGKSPIHMVNAWSYLNNIVLTSVRLKKCYLIGVFDIKSYSWFLWKKTICN